MQRTGFLWVTCLGLLALAASGCGSNQGCLEYANTVCNRQIQCSTLQSLFYGPNFDVCQNTISRNCELSTRSPDTNWTQDVAHACAQGLSTASCDDVLSGNVPAVCHPQGKRAVGGSCADGFQCQSLFCSRKSAHDCGSCTALPKVGESCATLGVCDYGLQCAQGLCAPLRGLTEACDSEFFCKPSLSCMQGTCQPPMLGGACGAGWECSDTNLQYCDPNTLTCQAFPFTVAKVGESCGNATDAVVGCAPGSYCKTMGSAAFGVCTATPTEGQPCAGSNQLCASPTTCISGTCQIFDRASCG